MTALRRVQRALAQTHDLGQLFRQLHAEIGCVMDTTSFLLGLFDETSEMVEVVGQIEAGLELPGGSFPLGHGFLSEAIRTRQPRLIRHWSVEGPRVQVQYATKTPGLPESTVTVPLAVAQRVIGVLSVQSYARDAYDEDDLFFLESVATQVAHAIDAWERAEASRAIGRASKLEAVLSCITDGLLVLDAAGRIVSLNPPARSIFGSIGAGIILGQPLDHEQWGQWPLGANVVGEALAPVIDGLQRGEAHRDVEVEVNASGRRVLSFTGTPIASAAGGPAGGVVVIRDVTNQRDIARLRDDLLSIASHDLRTPATVLRIQAQMLMRELGRVAPADVPAAERVQLMLDQTDRLTRMLNLLLDLTRVEAGRLDLHTEPTDLVALVQRVVRAVQALSIDHTIRLNGPRRLEGEWDAARLEQVVQNLLTNAIKYAPDGGNIDVTLCVEGDNVTVSVCDEGLGIAADELPNLFNRFYRVARTSGLEGSGIGLYVCQAIVTAHGGRIWATSDGPGRGSTFWLRLPLCVGPDQDGCA
ncbi:MAG: GAF domain-containing protein [Chloroflexi bacterium]|nr:GAF domain-containing protein [Chloroflexota bacterium]